MFQSQAFATAVYRTELAARLRGLGYEIERGEHGQPEIKGYSREYLEASSPRRAQITTELQEIGREGAGAAQVAAHRTRDSKEIQSPAEVLHRHRELATEYGHQPDWVVSHSFGNQHAREVDAPRVAQQGVTYARDHVFERAAVQDERAILQAALERSMGQASAAQVREEFERRTQDRNEFQTAEHAPKSAGGQYTTAAMVRMEREIVSRMQDGNFALENKPAINEAQARAEVLSRHPQLNEAQGKAADQILASQEKIVGLDGVAGAGKTTTLAVIREGAEANGYRVGRLCADQPGGTETWRSRHRDLDAAASPRQRSEARHGRERLYILDESSLASTKQMHDFVTRLHRKRPVLAACTEGTIALTMCGWWDLN